MTDEMYEAHFTIDGNQHILEWNRQAAELLGVPSQHAIGRHCFEVVEGRDPTGRLLCGPECPSRKALQDGHLVARTWLRIRGQDGHPTRLRCELTSLPSVPGGAIARLSSAETPGSNVSFDLAAIGSLATSLPSASLQESIGKALELLRDTLGAEAAEVFLAEPDKEGMVLTSYEGLFRHAFSQIVRFRPGEGYPGLVLSRQEPIIVDDLAADPRYLRTLVKQLGFRYYVSVPLRSIMGVPGSLGVAFRRSEVDMERAHRLLSWLSIPLGASVESHLMGLQQDMYSREEEGDKSGEEVFKNTLANVLNRMIAISGADGGILSVLAENGVGVAKQVSSGLASRSWCSSLNGTSCHVCPAVEVKQGVALYGAKSEWPLACQNAARIGSVSYCVPLVAKGEVVGVCNLNYSKAGTMPPTWNLVPLEVVANAAAIVIRDVGESLKAKQFSRAAFSQLARRLEVIPTSSLGGLDKADESRKTEIPCLDIRCFGPFEIYQNGQLLSKDRMRRKKAVTLLKILLAYGGRQLSKDELIELLWPEESPETRTGQLYVLVHELRQALEPTDAKGKWQFIRNEGDRYFFSFQGSCRVDVKEFNTFIGLGRKAEVGGDREGARASYEAAVELYRGDFLEEEPFEEWCQQERDRYREACLDALQRLASIYAGSKDWPQSTRCLRTALRIDALREEIHRSLMYSLWAGGRRDEAVKQYSICKELLRRELDVEPLPATEQLYKLICSKATPEKY